MKHYLVHQKVAGTLVSPERPFAAQGDWLQVICRGILAEFSLDVRVTPGIIRTHIQVLVPESFLEEFHAAISSLEGDIS